MRNALRLLVLATAVLAGITFLSSVVLVTLMGGGDGGGGGGGGGGRDGSGQDGGRSGPGQQSVQPQQSAPARQGMRGGPLKVAYAVTITKDGPYLDGAAVLKQSIDMLPTKHDVDMVAIVHPGVQSTRPALERLGIKIHEFPAPITAEEIRGEHLRTTIDKSGCCGALELLKLCGYKLTMYDRVVLLDMDVVMKKSIDHLFDIDKEIVFTYDYAMDGGGAAPPVQGGFLLIRPSVRAFEAIIDVVREGDFRPGSGWGGSNIGWCWGGQTVQGVVSFYYNRVDGGNFFEADPCKYNAMVSIKSCRDTPIEDVYSIHYTVCQKPWDCHPSDKPLCREMVKFWWDVRRELEKKMGLPISTTDGSNSRRREFTSLTTAMPCRSSG